MIVAVFLVAFNVNIMTGIIFCHSHNLLPLFHFQFFSFRDWIKRTGCRSITFVHIQSETNFPSRLNHCNKSSSSITGSWCWIGSIGSWCWIGSMCSCSRSEYCRWQHGLTVRWHVGNTGRRRKCSCYYNTAISSLGTITRGTRQCWWIVLLQGRIGAWGRMRWL